MSLMDLQQALEATGLVVQRADLPGVAPAARWRLAPADWARVAELAAARGWRHAGVWADALDGEPEPRGHMRVQALLALGAESLLLETEVELASPELPSQTPAYPGVDRLERHAQDLLGVRFLGHPDARRWTRHQAWPEGCYPLRAEVPLEGVQSGRTPSDSDYPFVTLHGSGIQAIPVGPVHAGIIEPGHFRFQTMGEDVLRLEERLGYVHRGIEKLAVGRDAEGLIRLAARVSGDSTIAHAWAACQALERAAGCEPPPRALHLRALLAERERIANHLGDIGAICNDVGFTFAQVQCARLRERWQRRNRELFGHRLLMDRLVPGGVAVDLAPEGIKQLRADQAELARAIEPLFDVVDDHPPLNDRLLTTGILSPEQARALGCTGYVGKASAQGADVRCDAPYPPYEQFRVERVIEQEGDVAARVRVRIREVHTSLALLDQLLDTLPAGACRVPLPMPEPDVTGLGRIEGWRGETLALVRIGAQGRIARYFPRDPSWFSWPALEHLILGNIVPDFPVCNKSVNGSYAGVDL